LYQTNEEFFLAEEVIMHPHYSSYEIVNDLCILKFNSNGDLNLQAHNSAAACLPIEGDRPAHGTRCWAAGWGLMNPRQMAEELQEVDLQAAVYLAYIDNFCHIGGIRQYFATNVRYLQKNKFIFSTF
jgi:hypothetical protein